MIVLQVRSWPLPSGEVWETWRVDWSQEGETHRRLFDSVRDAVEFMVEIALLRRLQIPGATFAGEISPQ